jgi:ABC-type transport system involved in multi-copper enzyme maturation permease subunit
MSKILLIVGMCIIILSFLLLVTSVINDVNTPIQNYGVLNPCPPKYVPPSYGRTCLNHPPTQQEIADAQKLKQKIVTIDSAPLRLPTSLYNVVSVILIVGTILLIILTGTIVGGEYSGGTIRLLSTRGPTRVQFLFAKIGAILICLVVGFIAMVLTGIVAGALFNLTTEVPVSWSFLNNGGWSYALLYPLAAMFGLFVYAMLALFLTTLGRATVVGVTGAIVWGIVENGFSNVVTLLPNGPVANVLKTLSNYLISSNVNALCNNINASLQKHTQYFIGSPPSPISNQHALLVLTGYVVVLIGLSIWINVRQDITN